MSTAPVTTTTESDELPEKTELHTTIPAQRAADHDSSPSPALSVDAVRQAVREVLTEELAPVLTALTAPDSKGDSPTGARVGVSGLARLPGPGTQPARGRTGAHRRLPGRQ